LANKGTTGKDWGLRLNRAETDLSLDTPTAIDHDREDYERSAENRKDDGADETTVVPNPLGDTA
jgi:hypothetical protein